MSLEFFKYGSIDGISAAYYIVQKESNQTLGWLQCNERQKRHEVHPSLLRFKLATSEDLRMIAAKMDELDEEKWGSDEKGNSCGA